MADAQLSKRPSPGDSSTSHGSDTDTPTTQRLLVYGRRRRLHRILRPLYWISAGYGLLYLTLFAAEALGALRMTPEAWALGLGFSVAGQLLVGLAAVRRIDLGRDWQPLGIATAALAIVHFALVSWLVPEAAPILMIAWLVNLAHISSFLGRRIAFTLATLTMLAFAVGLYGSPGAGSEPWMPVSLLALAAAQLYTIVSHAGLHHRIWKRELQSREMIARVPVGLFRTDAAGGCRYVNARWQRLAGLTLEEALGDGWVDSLHPDDRQRVREQWSAAMSGQDAFESEYRFKRRDGRETWLLGQASPVIAQDGQLLEWIGAITDITDRVHAEEKAEAANRVKTDFLANMSHEIRTPIAGIVGASELLSKQAIPPAARTYVELITTSAGSLLRLIDGLLDFSKIEAGKLAFEELDFSIAETVEAAVHMLRAPALAKGVELSSSIAASVPSDLHGDPLRLHQVLVNLISNAIKFTPQGQVRLDVTLDAERPAPPAGHRLRFQVSDSGIGIGEEALDQLFEPFVQADSSTSRRFGGSGLGLSICKRIVDLVGGDIEVRSTLGEGTTFTVSWPFAAVQGHGDPGSDEIPRRGVILRRRAEFHILLAEDNGVNRMIAVAQLDDLGYRVTPVENGIEVLESLAAGSFDLVLMDCQMPELDGYETTRRIRQRGLGGAHLPIIAVTAHAIAGDRQRALDAGMDDYISKPYDARTLDQTISRWLWVDETR